MKIKFPYFSTAIIPCILVLLILAACSGPTPTQTPLPAFTATPTPAGPLAPDGLPGETYYAPFPLTITLDGDTSDWDRVPRVTIPESAGQIEGATSVTFASAADEQYLYFMGMVTDSNVISGQHGIDYWNEDSLEFYINATGNPALTSYEDGVVQVTIPPLNMDKAPEEIVLGGVSHEDAEALVNVTKTEDGYLIEAAFPLKNQVWDIRPEHGGVLGFQVHLNGASQSNRNLKVIWSNFDVSDSSYYDPSVFGELIFFEIGQEQPGRIEPVVPTTEALIPVDANALYKQAGVPIPERVDDLLAYMSVAEKIGQMTLVEKGSIRVDDITSKFIGGLLSGGGGYPADGNSAELWAKMVDGFQEYALDSHLGIPLIYGVDAVHGHNNVVGAVIFPHNIGLGAANDQALMREIGRVTALEMAATGIYWNYAPGLMVPQDIRWGRTYEGFGENPDLVASLGAAFLEGMQSPDLLAPNFVIGTPKHFVGDGGTVWGSSIQGSYQIDQGVTEVDEAVLRALHLPPYHAAIASGARSIMISYSSWDGLKMHAQQYLINDVLKGEMGFTGFVVSDWGAIDQISGDYYQAVVTAINAGIDMNMVPYDYNRFINTLTKAVEAGDVPMSRIDDAVRRILTVKFEMGLFEQPFSQPDLLVNVGSSAHRALAREAVAKSLVLLKNDGNLLPISKNTPALFVAGAAADDIGIQSGGWSIEWQGKKGDITAGTTILEGIQAAVSPDTMVEYSQSGNFEGDAGAQDAVCLAVVGELPYAEGVGDSRNLNLPAGENRVLRRMEEACANLVVVLISGRPLIISDALSEWDAFVAAWLPGTEGAGVADVLFGDLPFTGTLSYTWPRSVDQLPLDRANVAAEGCAAPLFLYGYGITVENPVPAPLPVCED